MKKGFTLIELLAVIVILAIIALIATPIIINIIENARGESEKRSIELYASAVKNAIASYQLTHPNMPSSISDLTIEYEGNVECTTTEIYEDGNIYLADCTVNGSKVEGYTYGKQMVVKLCTANTTKAQAYVWQGNDDPSSIESYAMEEVGLLASTDGAYAKGVAYTCNFINENESNNMIFFVLSEAGDNVTLISGSNLGGRVAWLSNEDYLAAGGPDLSNDEGNCQYGGICADPTYGPLTAMKYLQEITSNWTKLTTDQKAEIKLPTKEQIEGAYTETMPTWLYGHTTDNVNGFYWTATPYADYPFISTVPTDHPGAITVTTTGGISMNSITTSDPNLRPVITLSKSLLD